MKARPARRAFAISGYVLGSRPPLFDQLQQRLAAIAQALALFECVEEFHNLARQLEQHFFSTGSTQTLTVDAVTLS